MIIWWLGRGEHLEKDTNLVLVDTKIWLWALRQRWLLKMVLWQLGHLEKDKIRSLCHIIHKNKLRVDWRSEYKKWNQTILEKIRRWIPLKPQCGEWLSNCDSKIWENSQLINFKSWCNLAKMLEGAPPSPH